jgi:hypothetical protein
MRMLANWEQLIVAASRESEDFEMQGTDHTSSSQLPTIVGYTTPPLSPRYSGLLVHTV